MESPDHQEWRARQRVSWRAIFQTTLCAGGVLFLMSGGSPWTTAGTMNAIMGRDVPLGFFSLLGLHFAISLVYVAVIAHVIYRLRLVAALFVGLLVGLGLYVINFAFFQVLPIQMHSPEIRAILVHVSFSLIASAVYKGASVPRPFRGSSETVAAESRRVLPEPNADDPEPEPVELRNATRRAA